MTQAELGAALEEAQTKRAKLWGRRRNAAHGGRERGRVRIVPTPGHSGGHQPVLVVGDGVTVCLAGDATFDDAQLRAHWLAGICEDVDAARRTLALLREQVDGTPTVYLPSHDADAARRLRALEPTRL